MNELNQYDAEALELMAGLLGKGFMIFPIDPEVKAAYYEVCARNGRNPHDQIRSDMTKRQRVLERREKEAKEAEDKEKAEKQSFLQQAATRLRTNEPSKEKDKK